ncbi:MAG: hypothetical protein RMM58_15670 [Chloroflexota bacterium]|nr:hypothetical protein [Dehalococcoidia bacterium]MDW8255310.1 hypothetical protein [Chloroflexota bacterium]
MFLASKSEHARLVALERELAERMVAARRRKRWELLARLIDHRRRVRRAILLREEFLGGRLETTGTTIADLLTRYE